MEQTDLIRRARYGPNTILAAGMSRALNTALNSAESELLLLVLILDRDSGRILDAECNIILGINSDYIASLLVGRNFYQELDEIILSIQQQYFGPGQRAVSYTHLHPVSSLLFCDGGAKKGAKKPPLRAPSAPRRSAW